MAMMGAAAASRSPVEAVVVLAAVLGPEADGRAGAAAQSFRRGEDEPDPPRTTP